MSDFFTNSTKFDFELRTLSLQVPAKEFGKDSDMAVEIIVEYAVNRADTKCYLGTLQLPIIKNENPVKQAVRILSALDESDLIQKQLPQYFEMELQVDGKGLIHLGRPTK